MAFPYTQIIVNVLPINDPNGTGEYIQIRITKDSRRPWLTNPRGVYNSSYTYALNDEVCYSGTFYRSIDATPFSGVTPSEDGVHWTKSDKFDWAWPHPDQVFFLQKIGGYDANIIGYGGTHNGVALFQPPGRLARYDAKEEGKLTPDRRELILNDGVTVQGLDGNGVSVSYDFSTDQYKSFLAWLFYNEDAITTWSFNRITTSPWQTGASHLSYQNTGDFECYWMGDSNNAANTGDDATNFSGRTPFARQASVRKVIIEGGINRLQNLVTRDIFPLIAAPGADSGSVKAPGTDFTDFQGQGGAVQFLGNYAAGSVAETSDCSIDARGKFILSTMQILYAAIWNKDWTGDNSTPLAIGGPGAHDAYGIQVEAVTSNIGMHFMTFDTLFSKVCARAQMGWDSTKSETPLTLWSDQAMPTTGQPNVISAKRVDGGNFFTHIGFPYEAVMGSDPRCNLNVSEINTPVSLGWNTPWADTLAKYARLLFGKITLPIDQTTKQQQLVFKPLNYLNTQTGSTLSSSIIATAASCTVASGAAFLTAATTAIGQDAATYLAAGNTIYAQFQYQGISQTIIVSAVNTVTNVITFTSKDTALAWPSGAALNPVQLLPIKWRDGKRVNREQTQVSARHIELAVKGDDDTVACKTFSGQALSIELPANVRKMGSLGRGTLGILDVTPNTKVALNQQMQGWNPFSGGPNNLGTIFEGTASAVSSAGSIGVWNKYQITLPTLDCRALLSGNANANGWTFWTESVPRGQANILQWRNTDNSQGYGWVTSVVSKNVVEVSIKNSGISAPATGCKVLADYTTGSLSSLTDYGWLFDVTIGSAYLTAADNVNTLFTNRHLYDSGQMDIFGSLFLGQSICLPAYGIFSIISLDDDGSGNTKITLDRSIPYGALNVEARIGPPDVSSNGWAFAAYLYYMDNGAINNGRYASVLYNNAGYDDSYSTHYWRPFRNQYDIISRSGNVYENAGAYTVSRLTVGMPEGQTDVGNITAPSDAYGTAYYAPAQAYCSRFIGIFGSPTRDNVGVLGNGGSITEWSNGDSYIEQREGNVRCYMMDGHELNEFFKSASSIRSREWPDFSAPLTAARFPVLLKGGGNTSGGAGGGGGIGAGGGSPVQVTGIITTIDVPQFTADQNDFTISNGFTSPITILNFSSDALRNLTGIANGVKNIVLILRNVGTNPIILKNEDTGSIAANRFNIAGGDTTLSRGGMSFVYDAAISRWTPFAMVL